MTRIPIVNEQDEFLYFKDFYEATRDEIRQITRLHVFNSAGEYLLAQRQKGKILEPGVWGPTVAGTVDEGETYEINVVKETKEELGLTGLDIQFIKKYYQHGPNGKRYCAVFTATTDQRAEDLTLQEEEVADARFVSLPELFAWYDRSPEDFTKSFGETIELLKEMKK